MPALLNGQQEKFAQNIVAGMTQRDAYRDAYPDGTYNNNSLSVRACELMKAPGMAERIQELQAAASMGSVMQREQRMELLTRMANDDELHPKYRMQAVDLLNKMCGEYTKKVEAVLTPGYVSNTAAEVAAILDE